ncbi:zinc ribbon domain-containing protein [Niveibacterium sp. SC-1]|uniref:zinc ribbon domain-containing protein n=1 Tax=Niveibacterium sp. SC-1 TaxID=3135646 RepID=UPI00311F3706
MSYDYNSQTGQLNIPNPHRLENFFLFAAAVLYFGTGVAMLLLARGHIMEGASRWPPVAVALVLVALGALHAAKAFQQLRYYFGRGRPVGLAPEVQADMQGRSAGSERIKEILRARSLQYGEPKGAFNGLLYWIVPNLIHAPDPIRTLASRQFRHALSLAIFFVAFLVAFFGVSGDSAAAEHQRAWLGLGFWAYALFALVGPNAGVRGQAGAELTVGRFVIITAVAILAPVLLLLVGKLLPPLGGFSPYPHVFVLFLVGLFCSVIFFVALIAQLSAPPQTLVEQTQESWNLRIHPGQILGEFERAMQERWTEGIPNRVYSRVQPSIDLAARAGEFQGEIIEETQPLPLNAVTLHFANVLGNPRYRWVLILSLLGVVAAAGASFAAAWFGMKSLGASAEISFPALAYAASFASLGVFSARAAASLWQRVDFESRIYAIEISGQYVTAQLEQGRVLEDSVRAASTMVKVEGMTFRFWAAQLTTVILGKDAQRDVLAMNSADISPALIERLRQFAREQSVLVAPTAGDDLRRQAALEQFNQLAAGGRAEAASLPPQAAAAITAPRYCPACGVPAQVGHRFCGACGAALG